jgi:hypothetical protein
VIEESWRLGVLDALFDVSTMTYSSHVHNSFLILLGPIIMILVYIPSSCCNISLSEAPLKKPIQQLAAEFLEIDFFRGSGPEPLVLPQVSTSPKVWREVAL